MSSAKPDRKPMIALVRTAYRAFQQHMLSGAQARGRAGLKPAHDAVFALLGDEGVRAADLAARAGITRQSMGEVIRDMVGLGLLEMVPDPDDGRAKIVRYTAEGKQFAYAGYRHLRYLEERFEEEFGDDYEAARRVLERVVELLDEVDALGEVQGS